MRRNLLYAFIGLLLCVSCARPETDPEIIAMQGLLNRVVPDYVDKFKLERIENDSVDCFELESAGRKSSSVATTPTVWPWA